MPRRVVLEPERGVLSPRRRLCLCLERHIRDTKTTNESSTQEQPPVGSGTIPSKQLMNQTQDSTF